MMKIKLALLDSDQNYLKRIVSAFETKYADKLELYSFTDLNVALGALDQAKIDVFLASDNYEIDVISLPKRCGFAYFVDFADAETKDDQRAICKFQKAELIYKQILNIYAENSNQYSRVAGSELTQIVAFTSPCGGVGTSSVAAGYAAHLAMRGKKILYLNLEHTGSADLYFSGEGQFCMSDVIYALKTKKSNLSLKIESFVRQDVTGVSYFASPHLALDMMELQEGEILQLLKEIKMLSTYDYVVMDMDFEWGVGFLERLKSLDCVVLVSDGSEVANVKIQRANSAIEVLDQNNDSYLLPKITLLYNRFSNKSGKALDDISFRQIGGIPRFENATCREIIRALAERDVFDKIIH